MIKNLNKFLVAGVLILFGSAVVAAPGEKPEGGTFLPVVKAQDFFVLKAEKELVGAKVEIFSDEGELVTAHRVQKRKMIIDFGGMANGTYTIRLTKGDEMRTFSYNRK